jgi:hypothetical protein
MTRYYRDLHDRELLSQAESMLCELHRRRLLDIRVSRSSEQARCPVDSIVRNGNALSIVVDRAWEPAANSWSDANENAVPGGR